jgi:hypothetical protein
MTDSDKLLALALWFKERDARYSVRNREVPDDLRRIAQEIAKRDARIKELIEANNRLQDAVLKDSCPWCGLNNKSNVKRETEAREC